jgi:hypothetical protein
MLEHQLHEAHVGNLLNFNSVKSPELQTVGQINPSERPTEEVNELPQALSPTFPGETSHQHKHVTPAESLLDPLPEICDQALTSSHHPSISGLEAVNGHDSQSPREDVACTIATNSSLIAPDHFADQYEAGHEDVQARAIQDPNRIPCLFQYLQKLYSFRQDFDCHIWYRQPSDIQTQHSFYAHGVILSRSPVLRNLFLEAKFQQRGNAVIQLPWATPIDVHRSAFELVLKFLYSDVLLERLEIGRLLHTASLNDSALDGTFESNSVKLVISYGLAGHLLQLWPIQTRGLQLFSEMMNWDVAEVACKAALEVKQLGEFLVSNNPSDVSGSELEWYGQELLNTVFHFLSRKWDTDLSEFKIDISQPSILPTYLPANPELTLYLRNAVLKGLKFGMMPVAAVSQTSTMQCRAVSSILVNLPFANLAQLYAILKTELMKRIGSHNNIDEVFSAIIEEREKRRRIVSQGTQITHEQKTARQAQWNVVGYREAIQNIGNEMKLTRDQTSSP